MSKTEEKTSLFHPWLSMINFPEMEMRIAGGLRMHPQSKPQPPHLNYSDSAYLSHPLIFALDNKTTTS